MSSYQQLAGAYDELTWDVGYEKRADFLEKLFRRSRIPVRVVLDLACGTGTMTWLLTGRGYELIGVDGSEEMLAAAMSKTGSVQGVPPIFLHQSMPKLDLYGTVDAAVCCLDSLNYLTDPADVRRTFRRLHLFIAPGGVLVFDAANRTAVKMIAKTWLKSANIQDVGAYFAVSDAPQEISAWDSRLQVTSRGYMLGYTDLKDPSVSGFFRFLARVGDGMMKMQIVRIKFGGR